MQNVLEVFKAVVSDETMRKRIHGFDKPSIIIALWPDKEPFAVITDQSAAIHVINGLNSGATPPNEVYVFGCKNIMKD